MKTETIIRSSILRCYNTIKLRKKSFLSKSLRCIENGNSGHKFYTELDIVVVERHLLQLSYVCFTRNKTCYRAFSEVLNVGYEQLPRAIQSDPCDLLSTSHRCRQSSANTFSNASTRASASCLEKMIGGLSLSTLCKGPSVLIKNP